MAKEKTFAELRNLKLIPVGQVAEYLAPINKSITRQAIHKAIRAGKIKAYRSLAAEGKRPVVLVNPKDIIKYLENRS